jgi:hypothetical protein
MAKSTVLRESMAVAYSAKATFASLNTADPGTTGANTTGTRVSVTWTAGTSDGSVSGTAAITVGSGVTVTHASLWDASTSGNFCEGGALPASYTGPGTYTLTVTYTESA